MADKSNPLNALLKAQRDAMQTFSDAAQGLIGAASSGGNPGQSVDLMRHLSGLSSAMGTLAASSVTPLEEFLESQRQFADTMANFAEMHRQMAELLDSVASRQHAAVDAASTLLGPISALGKAQP